MNKNPTWDILQDMVPENIFGKLWDYYEEDTGKQPGYNEIVPDSIMNIVNA